MSAQASSCTPSEATPAAAGARLLVGLFALDVAVLAAVLLATLSLGSQRDFLSVALAQILVLALGAGLAATGPTAHGMRAWVARLAPSLLAVPAAAILPVLALAARPLAVAAVLAAGALPARRAAPAAPRARTLLALAAGSVLFGLALAAQERWPLLHFLEERWAAALSAASGILPQSRVVAGPTPLGTDVLLLAGLVALATTAGGGPAKGLRALGGLALLQLAYVGLAAPLRRLQADVGIHGTIFETTWLLVPLTGLLLVSLQASPGPEPRERRWALALPGLAAVLLVVATQQPSAARAASGPPPLVLLHDVALDGRIPAAEDEAFGQIASGMFGFLPAFLRGAGFEVRSVDLEGEPDLAGAAVLVLVNLQARLSPAVEDRVRAFVEGGGGLLLAGDHTGMERIRDPSNAIVGPWGIELAFDSAVGLLSSWADGMRFLRHPATRSLFDELDAQVWTGASLDLRPPAFPLVVGRNAYSDAGDAEAEDRGHLGDMHHHHGERLGDLVLIAGAEPGRGRALVLGDTSPLQNLALGQSRQFVRDAFDWLAGATPARRPWRELLLGLALGAAVLAAAHGAAARPLGLALLAIAVGATGLRAPARAVPAPLGPMERPIAHVDLSHGERATRLGWYPSGLAGIQHALFRAGFWPFLPHVWSEELLAEASLVVLAAPTADWEPEELAVLDRWLAAGGVAVLAVGRPESQNLPRLLDELGVAIGKTPLGPLETVWRGTRLRLQNAYPLEVLPDDARVECELFGHPVAAWLPRGRGGVWIVGDSRVLWNRNVEDFDSYVPENVEFVRLLLEELRGREQGT